MGIEIPILALPYSRVLALCRGANRGKIDPGHETLAACRTGGGIAIAAAET